MGIEFGGKRYKEDVIIQALRKMLRDFEKELLPATATDKELCSWFLQDLNYYNLYHRYG